jgi:hypothetical protein
MLLSQCKTLFISIITGFVLVSFIESRVNEAKAGFTSSDAFITVGLSTASGAVLGLSTTAFYSNPSEHFGNVLIGAGLGLIVGVGISSYLAMNEDSQDEIDPDEILLKQEKKELKEKDKGEDVPSNDSKKNSMRKVEKLKHISANNSIYQNSWYFNPSILRTKEFVISAKILELRF